MRFYKGASGCKIQGNNRHVAHENLLRFMHGAPGFILLHKVYGGFHPMGYFKRHQFFIFCDSIVLNCFYCIRQLYGDNIFSRIYSERPYFNYAILKASVLYFSGYM